MSSHHRAARLRGIHKYGLADSLHLATAVEQRLDRFLTNDSRLGGFLDMIVEILP
jgi:predicted nucleic acid-binding protein